MPRTVTIHATTNNLVGDETYEAWLRHASDAWALVDAGTVDQVAPTQSFTFAGLVDGAHYSLQIRMKRAGRYRVGYLGGDPNGWPGQSRIDFTVGSLIGVGAPLLTVDDWTRVDADHSKFVLHITPDALDQNIELYDNNVLVHTFVQPHSGPITYDYVDSTLYIGHTFKARHVNGSLGGPFSTIITKYAGPAPITNLIQANDPIRYNEYDVSWDGPAGPYRLHDDYPGENANVTTSSQFLNVHHGMLLTPTGPTETSGTLVRVRREITTFGVTDTSDWTEIGVSYEADM